MADELQALAILRQPEEAVGLLTADGRVFELPNRSGDPESHFEVHKADILSTLRKHEIEDLGGLTLWHSHPRGGVGPSRIDMQQKLPFFNHLVVTITGTGPLFTWY
jgi:proteasome lid subunit RPN8/RPN11